MEHWEEAAREHLRHDRKIDAIKLVREHMGLGLKEAKDLVEAWERGEHPRTPEATRGPVFWKSWELEARELLRSGAKLDAIRVVREAADLGLKDAKDLVEAWERGEIPGVPHAPSRDARTASWEDEARALAASGKILEAIKLVREATQMSLHDAKDRVESWLGK